MDSSFKAAPGFCYRRGDETIGEEEEDDGGGLPGLLDIYVHHARNIHNICIYANQDVYAKFSLTCTPDDAISTGIVAGGGKNPQFDERLTIKVPRANTVLKCEIWMLSRARNYLEDQLLGFALVPLSSVVAKERKKLTQDFTLSSTDLFHSPAGTVQLTLTLHTSDNNHGYAAESSSTPNMSITSEVVILDPAEFGRIEFPDIEIASENERMVSEYFDIAAEAHASRPRGAGTGPFLQLGASPESMEDYEMTANSNDAGSDSPDGSIHNSGPFTSSTTTSLSEDNRNSADCGSMEKNNRKDSATKNCIVNVVDNTTSGANSPDTPTSKCSVAEGKEETDKLPSKEEAEMSGGKENDMDSVFKSPMGSINLEAEQNAMQQQVVDMYMRSMQQFTESLAKMKLPMDLDAPKAEDGGDVIQSQKSSSDSKLEQQMKKDSSRVFYGSRAFF